MQYYIIATIFSLLFIVNPQNQKHRRVYSLFFILIFLTIFSAIRYHVGYDYYEYENIFFNTESFSSIIRGDNHYFINSRIEKGFLLIISIVKIFTNNVNWLYFVVSLIINSLILIRINEYSSKFYLNILLFFSSSFLAFNFGLLRQGLAIAIFFYSIKFIKERNLLRYLIACGIAVCFHISSIVIFPMYFFVNKKKQSVFYLMAVILAILLSCIDFSDLLLNFVPNHVANYMTDQRQSATISLFSLGIILKFLILLFGFMNRNRLARYHEYYDIVFNLYFVHVVLFIIFRNNFLFGARLPLYFSIFDMLLISCFVDTQNDKYVKFITKVVALVYAFLMLRETLSNGVYIPYQTIFF